MSSLNLASFSLATTALDTLWFVLILRNALALIVRHFFLSPSVAKMHDITNALTLSLFSFSVVQSWNTLVPLSSVSMWLTTLW